MTSTTTQQTTLLYKYYRLLIIPALLWYVWMAQYVLTSTTGEIMTYTRWVSHVGVFFVTPLNTLIGFFIMRRLPGNVIGPALIVLACAANSELSIDLIVPVAQGSLNEIVLWVFMHPAFLILGAYFPSGKLHPQHVVVVVVVCFYLMMVVTGVLSLFMNPISYGTQFWNGEALPNPFLIEALAPYSEVFVSVDGFLLNVLPLGSVLLVVYRYIHTTSIERKQVRILVFGILIPQIAITLPMQMGYTPTTVFIASIGILTALTILPITIMVGVLFHKLWDIDVIIRRTLIYAVVSALLALTYFTIVLVTQTLLSGFIPEDNTLLIVASTLAIAALFNPLQQRVQQVIDRLFYRKRYDAEATLDQFSEKIRDAMDAKAIEQHIVDTVTNTIQPESVSLWVVERSSKS